MLAHWVAARPGAVTTMPAMGAQTFALFAAGGLWLALWSGRVRLLGLVPVAMASLSLAFLRPPDVLVSGDGRHVGITGTGPELLVLRGGRSDFARENLSELAGMDGSVRLLADWPGARCSRDFCAVTLRRGGRDWRLLVGRSRDRVEERALAAACDRADVVISDRWLPRSCRPALLKADRRLLSRSGGLAIDLERGRVETVAEAQGQHGWWREAETGRLRRPPAPAPAASGSETVSPGDTAREIASQ
jgi:competence protein ComEC